METPPVGISSPRDVLTVTQPKVLESLHRATTTSLGEVYLLSYTTWKDTDGAVNKPDEEVRKQIDEYFENDPKGKFFTALDIATKVSDTVSTWNEFEPEISPELNDTTIEWLAEGILMDKNEEVVLDIALIANMVSGRIAAGDSFLTTEDLEKLVGKIDAKVAEAVSKDKSIESYWHKIKSDMRAAEKLAV